MAERLTENGYAVLMPNMFYRYGPAQPLDFATDRDKIMEMIFSLNEKGMMQDTEHFLAYLDAQPGVLGPKVGCTGYCMGGAPSLTSSATFPDRVVAAASFHGGRLATDAPDSPHSARAPEMRGRALHRRRRRGPLPRPRRDRAPRQRPQRGGRQLQAGNLRRRPARLRRPRHPRLQPRSRRTPLAKPTRPVRPKPAARLGVSFPLLIHAGAGEVRPEPIRPFRPPSRSGRKYKMALSVNRVSTRR